MRLNATTLLAASLFGTVVPHAFAQAQTSHPHASAAAASKDAPAPEPQQTTATFGDWTLRCAHAASAQMCEVTQGVNNQDRPFAQVAIGRPAKGKPLQMAILVPPSVTLGHDAALLQGKGASTPLLELAWRRCLPGGCVADSALPPEALKRIRSLAAPAQIVFSDGGGRAVGLPFSSKGLSQAMDALAKEDPG